MRIITGSARGVPLQTVPGEDLVRPTSQKVKEAVFSSIQFEIEGRRILDLFAGCGQLGIEALSRGAESAVFVDSSNISLDVVKQNLNKARLSQKAKVIKSDYYAYLSTCKDKFDIAFLDPPYYEGMLNKALLGVCKIMSDYGIVICEHPITLEMPKAVNGFEIYREYKYSKIAVTVYKKGENKD